MTGSPICSICGKQTDERTYSGKVTGLLVDFIHKTTADIRLAFCDQCLLKLYWQIENRSAVEKDSDADLGRT